MANPVNSVGRRLLDALLPQHCALCGLRSGHPLPLCRPCAAELPPNDRACSRCALPLPLAAADGPRLCGECITRPPPFDAVRAPWLYGEYLGYLIHRWKFAGDLTLTPLLAQLWLAAAGPPPPVDALVPVPLHWWREWRRGYNQSALLARQLARHGAPGVRDTLVRRHRATAAQSGSSASARARNLRGAFTARGPCDNLRLAVIDDVFTTGATAAEVARTLKRAGAAEVEVWCLARTPKPDG
ncbi:MAG: ComF family protein [Halioglobus sp.]|nr:ComF family protein [Halioglobus sp.]